MGVSMYQYFSSYFCWFGGLSSQGRGNSPRGHSKGLTKLIVETNWPLWAPHATLPIDKKGGYYIIGVIVPDYEEEIGLLLYKGERGGYLEWGGIL